MNLNTAIKAFLLGLIISTAIGASPVEAKPSNFSPISTDAIIQEINSLRSQNGLAPLIVDPILMGTAKSTADYMAVNDIHGHIGQVKERVAAAGFGNGATVWATENFAIGTMNLQDLIYVYWNDDMHMIPMRNSYYTHVGAGVAEANGMYFYIVHAAYVSGGSYQSGTVYPTSITSETSAPVLNLSEIIYPVQTVTPHSDGSKVHTVQQGQTFYSLIEAYGVASDQIRQWNGLPTNAMLYIGQELIVSGTSTPGAPPTQEIEVNSLAPQATSTIAVSPTPLPSRTIVAAVTAKPTQEAVQSEPDKDDNLEKSMTWVIGGVLLSGIAMLALGFFLGKRTK